MKSLIFFKESQLEKKQLHQINGGANPRTIVSGYDNGNGSISWTYVNFDDLNNNGSLDQGEPITATYVIVKPKIQHSNALQ